MTSNHLTPVIRFKGFTDAWEQRKLGEVFKQTVEYVNPIKENLELWSVTVEKGLTPKTERYNREALVKKNDKFKVVHPGEIVYNPMNMTIGSIGYNTTDKSVAVSGYYVTMKMNIGFNNNFFYTWLPSFKAINLYRVYATGSLIEKQRIQFPTLSSIIVLIPLLDEQTKIGNFFKQLDDTIALHQRELDLLKEQKKGFLQKMFPKKDEVVPEIRFAGFTDAWEQRKLGEIFNIMDGDRGKNYPSENEFFNTGATLFLDTGNVRKDGFDFSNTKYITSEKDSLLRSGKLELHDFVLTSRGTLGNVAYYDEKILSEQPSIRINSAMLILRPLLRKQVSDNYMASVLRGNIIDTFMSRNHVGSAQPHITKRDFSKVVIGIPETIKEQTKIGNFFKQLDDTIELHQCELEKLQEMKKAFLQKMFV